MAKPSVRPTFEELNSAAEKLLSVFDAKMRHQIVTGAAWREVPLWFFVAKCARVYSSGISADEQARTTKEGIRARRKLAAGQRLDRWDIAPE